MTLQALLNRLRAYLQAHPAQLGVTNLLLCLALASDPITAPEAAVCFTRAIATFGFELILRALIQEIINLLGGSSSMACVPKHSTQVAGNGLCCAQVASGALRTTATSLPPYIAGELATNPSLFPHVTVTTSKGKCGNCLIVGSKSPKHPGKPVLKFVPGGPGCPVTGTGCCALTTQ